MEANELDELIQETTLEDCTALDAIQSMIYTRANAVGLKFAPIEFDHNATLIDKLKLLRDRVYSLAPNFVNMDYPYWENGWAQFPKMYTTGWRQDWDKSFISVDELAMDEEHNINKLPQNDTSFDDDTIDLYRKYLSNLVYWLRKFRYAKALKTWFDKSFQRNWDWILSWNDNQWQQTSYATVNGNYVENVEDSVLRAEQDGTVYQNGPRQIRNEGYIEVHWEESGHMTKMYQYYDSWVTPRPVTETLAGEHIYEVSNIPCNLTTANPTCYNADLLWFIVPSNDNYYEHQGKGYLVNDTNDFIVTDKEHLQYHEWGNDQQHYSAWEWHAVAGTGESENRQTTFVNGQYKETYDLSRVWSTPGYNRRSTKTTVKTNWTSNGDRSAVVINTTEQDTDTNQPYDNDRWRHYFEMQDFGLVTWQEGVKPCFNAGSIAPHGSLTYHVCDQNNLPLPTYSFAWDYVPNDTYELGIDDTSHMQIDCSTMWYPILDFKDYEIPEPEEEQP